jgi:colanic acid/amylovoran biosynthesis glycosyltransferase
VDNSSVAVDGSAILSAMPKRLCVLLPEIGVTSETFLSWDVQSVLPGSTVVISDPPPAGETTTGVPAWGTRGAPTLAFRPVAGDPPPADERKKAVAEFLRVHEVEVVLVEYLDFADRWFDFLRGLGVLLWIRGHGIDVSARLRDRYWQTAYLRYAAADGIIVPSRAAARRLMALGLPAGLIHVVRYGVDVPAVPPQRTARGCEEIRCVAVGRLVAKKAPLLLLEAFRLASEQDSRLRLDLVGDGPLMPAVEGFLDMHDLRGRIQLHGRRPHAETLRLVRSADIMLHHAVASTDDGDAEGQPVSIIEAMGAGLAVVATHHEGIPELITDGLNGRLVAERDVAAMARAVLDAADNPDERLRLGQQAWRTIRSGQTHHHVRQTLLSLMGLTAPTDDLRAGRR